MRRVRSTRDVQRATRRGLPISVMLNPFVHIELNTGDVAAAKKFYSSIFGWKLADMPMGPGMVYTTIQTDGTGGGMAEKQDPSAPNAWLPYVLVDDVKATVAKARRAGAQVVIEHQVVGTMGALGVLVDPTGAAIGLWQAFGPMPEAPKPTPKKAATKKGAKKAAPKKAAPKKAAPKKAANARKKS
jgi:predicted enzyme related to lactoylglutathione lyase